MRICLVEAGEEFRSIVLLLSFLCSLYKKCVATLWHDRIYLFVHEGLAPATWSSGHGSHTCTHRGPIFGVACIRLRYILFSLPALTFDQELRSFILVGGFV